mmetsp:Transcript_2988/g.11741  ORF Transcript_2988/g.11741 Transcript_2988/m.11741 type:complete len:450 (-) Transcript_2988:162-1511(-)
MNGNALSPAAARDGHEGKDHDRDFTHVYRTTPVTPRPYKLVVGAWIYACAVAIYTHYPDEHGRIASLAHLYYQAPFIALLAMWLWGLNLWAWCVLMRLNPHPLVVFELDDARIHMGHREVFKCAFYLTAVFVGSLALFLKYAATGVDDDLAKVMPVGLYVGCIGALFVPLEIWYAPSRRFLAKTLRRLFAPSAQPVGFADFFLADVACSMAKSFSDVERAVCSMLAGKVMAAVDGDGTCGSTSWKIPVALAVPSAIRLFQCLRQRRDTGDETCAYNALKYLSAMPVIGLSAAKYHVDHALWLRVLRPAWIVCAVVNTAYSYYWDVRHDWDLNVFKSWGAAETNTGGSGGGWAARGRSVGVVYGDDGGVVGPMGRRERVYPPSFYRVAVVLNLAMRASWTYKLSAHLRHNAWTVLLCTGLEITRRFLWAPIRVEKKYLQMRPRVSRTAKV